MADVSVLAQATHAAPKDYLLSGAQDLTVKSVTGSFDGSGAGGSYIPAVQIVDPSGAVVATFPCGTTLAAGASADVSWFPSVGPTTSTGGSGLQFETEPQSGGWLYWETTGADAPPNGYGWRVQDASAAGILLEHTGATGQIVVESDNGNVIVSADTLDAELQAGRDAAVLAERGINIHAHDGDVAVAAGESIVVTAAVQGVSGNSLRLEITAGPTVTLADDGSLTISTVGAFTLTGLPTVNPGGSGIVWNNGGVLSIT